MGKYNPEIISPRGERMSDSQFYESWEKRKQRRLIERANNAKRGERPLGFFISEAGETLVMRSYERTQSMTATAKECKCNRATVRRVLLRRKVPICDGRKRLGTHNTDFFEFYARIPGPIYRAVSAKALANNRKIAREIIAALAKLYL